MYVCVLNLYISYVAFFFIVSKIFRLRWSSAYAPITKTARSLNRTSLDDKNRRLQFFLHVDKKEHFVLFSYLPPSDRSIKNKNRLFVTIYLHIAGRCYIFSYEHAHSVGYFLKHNCSIVIDSCYVGDG